MALNYTFENTEDYFKVTLSGVMDNFDEAITFSQASADATRASNKMLVLSDERGLTHRLSIKEMLRISNFIVMNIPFVRKFAIVGTPHPVLHVEYLKSFSAVENFTMDVFIDIQEAEDWLKEI